MDRGGSDPAVELRAWLIEQGADPDATDPLAHRAAEFGSDLVLERDSVLSARELAERAGLPLGKVVAIFHDLGVAVPGLDAPQFTDVDVRFRAELFQAGDRAAASASSRATPCCGWWPEPWSASPRRRWPSTSRAPRRSLAAAGPR